MLVPRASGRMASPSGTTWRVNRTILEDLELKIFALRALHAKLRDLEAGENFGGVVTQARPR